VTKHLIASAVLLAAAGSAQADHRGWYLEGALGVSDAGTNSTQFNARLAADGHSSESTIDENDIGYSARIGYQLDQAIGFEFAATSFGEADLNLKVDTSSNPNSAAESIAEHLPVLADSVSASMTFSTSPFKSDTWAPLSLSAKLGVAAWKSEVTLGSPSAGFVVVVDRESVDPVYAFAGSYAVSERFAIGLEFSHLDQGPSQSNELLAATLKYSLNK
jgi:hypothetical protein